MQITYLGEVKLERIVRAEADVKPGLEELGDWIPLVGEEERVVAQRAHGDPDLLQVEEVLQGRHLPQQDPVCDGMRRDERRGQVVRVASLTAVRSEHKSAFLRGAGQTKTPP